MGQRFYKFFAIMRMALKNKALVFSAPANRKVYSILVLLRTKGLIGGFSLDFTRNKLSENYWSGYPKYKVYLKYNYLGMPIVKKIDCFKLTKTNFTRVKEHYPKLNYNIFYLVSEKGFKLLTKITKNHKILAKITI